jgi:hypothetical protein
MMDATLIAFRLVHVLSGVFWVGAMVFLAAFLVPSVNDVGPDGGKVIAALSKRRFMNIMPVIAGLTILSGLWLYWRASTGFSTDYMKSGPGHAYALGALCAITAFIIGMTVTRPAMLKALQLGQAAATAEPGEREKILATAKAIRERGAKAGNIIALLLLIAAAAMAVGRYV